jgi:hypothetical protein
MLSWTAKHWGSQTGRKEQAMAGEERDPDDVRTTRPPRRTTPSTDRLTPEDAGYARASDRNWRGDRAARTRRSFSLPSSWQEFMLWLQYGGLRVLLIIAGVTAVIILGLFLLRGMNRPLVRNTTPTAVQPAANHSILEAPPTVTPVFSPTAAIASQDSEGARFRVVNTGPDGLFLRLDHSTDNQPIKTLPEDSIVTIVGEDFSGPDRVWKHIRDAEGSEGWAAADFLKPVQ